MKLKKNLKEKSQAKPTLWTYSEQEKLEIIQKVAKRYRNKYTFSYYTADDIEQECWIFSVEALSKYDGRTPLENFLAVHFRNRLLSLKRDKFYRPGSLSADLKKNVIMPVDLSVVNLEHENCMVVEDDLYNKFTMQEFIDLIDKELDARYREDFLKMCSGVKIPKKRAEVIKDTIRQIFNDYNEIIITADTIYYG